MTGQDVLARAYTVRGNMKKLKTPVFIGGGYSILGISRDKNGNSLLRVMDVDRKSRSIQYKAIAGMSTIYIEELVVGSPYGDFIKKRAKDVKNIIAYLDGRFDDIVRK